MEAETASNPEQHIKKLGSLIKGIKFAMVSTVDAEENLHSCPLTTQQIDFDGDLWFIVGRNSEVFANLQADARVNVSYSSEKAVYVSASGHSQVVEDREMLEKLWNPAYKIWFEKGIDDPNIALLKIAVDKAEYWEAPSFAVTRMLAFARALITKDKKVGEHHKINLN
jgi:general stress protein 26